MQEFKKPSGNLFKAPEPVKVKAPNLKLPDPHEMARLAGLVDVEQSKEDRKEAERDQERAKAEELKEAERDELEARAQAREQRQEERRRRAICCCGSRSCRIGPMNRYVEE